MIIVTGSGGIVGTALMDLFKFHGIDALGINREKIDLANCCSLSKYIHRPPNVIIHLAAAVPHSLKYPDNTSSAQKTKSIDATVFKASKEWNCRTIYASTCSLYDKSIHSIKFEDTFLPTKFKSPYMKAKYDGEQIFSSLSSYSILRLPAPLGPNLPDTVVAKRFLKDAISSGRVKIWGSGYRQQNYVDVKDIADAFLKASFSNYSGIFNISAEQPTTMLELAKLIVKEVPGSSYELTGITDPLEMECANYSNAKAKERLGWVTSVKLSESIRTMLKNL